MKTRFVDNVSWTRVSWKVVLWKHAPTTVRRQRIFFIFIFLRTELALASFCSQEAYRN